MGYWTTGISSQSPNKIPMINTYSNQAKLVLRILPFLSAFPQFALKGGTAINYFIRPFPRLSVDIDLTWLPLADRQTTLLEISKSLRQLTANIRIRNSDYKIIPKKMTNHTVALRISDGNVVIKVEPNLVIRGAVYEVQIKELVNEAEDELELYASAQCLSIEDLYAGKICAALDRQHPRDLYDIKLLLDNEGITERIRQAFVVYLASHPRPMSELLEPNFKDIAAIYETEFRGMTRVDIPMKQLQTAREQLIKQIRTDLTKNERLFLLSIKQGEPQWDQLPLPGIHELPAIRWKIFNIKKMQATKRKIAEEKLQHILEL